MIHSSVSIITTRNNSTAGSLPTASTALCCTHPSQLKDPPAARGVVRPCEIFVQARLGHVKVHVEPSIDRKILLDLVVYSRREQERIIRTAHQGVV